VPGTPPPAVPGSLVIQWYGASSVYLITPGGDTIWIDPAGPQSGYHLPYLGKAAALLASRDTPDYDYGAVADADQRLVRRTTAASCPPTLS